MNAEKYKALHDLEASLNILHANIQIFHAGNWHVYRVIAVELRKLLCDGASTLLTRVLPDLHLNPLVGYISKEQEEEWRKEIGRSIYDLIAFKTTAEMHFDGKGGARIVRLFDETREAIALEDWLSQPLFSREITIKELIRSVADKESAHSDRKYNDTLKILKSIKIIDQDIHIKHVVAIGEYILKVIEPLFEKEVRNFNARFIK